MKRTRGIPIGHVAVGTENIRLKRNSGTNQLTSGIGWRPMFFGGPTEPVGLESISQPDAA